MTRSAPHEITAAIPRVAPAGPDPALAERLGLNVPAGWWPSRPTVKEVEAAGFSWLQVHAPPESVLGGARLRVQHADALRDTLSVSTTRVVLHAPDALSVGSHVGDHLFQRLLDYAARVAAQIVVYHPLQFPVDVPGSGRRAFAEERSLRRLARRAERLGVTIALENLAPVYPSAARMAHYPDEVRGLAVRLDSEAVGLCFDIGHAHITSRLRGETLPDHLAAAAEHVVLFHVHDNLGVRETTPGTPGGADPLRLDLHLPPGGGTVPWAPLAPILAEHRAPLMLEVHPPHRPDPVTLAALAGGLFA